MNWAISKRRFSIPEVLHAYYRSLNREVSLLHIAEESRLNSPKQVLYGLKTVNIWREKAMDTVNIVLLYL